jgi:hypothetical protein
MTPPKRQYPHLDAPVALVACWADGSGITVTSHASDGAALVAAQMVAQRHEGVELRIVSQPELLAWVRANGRVPHG